MGNRFCARCGTEVEDAGGYCLLGHPLRLTAPVDSLKALRAEVDRAFEDARVEVATVLAGIPDSPERVLEDQTPLVSTPPAPPARPDPFAQLRLDEPLNRRDPMDEFAPAPRMDWGPDKHFFKRR